MILLLQSGPKDCFATCFRNALLYFGIPLQQAVKDRLSLFADGTEHCTIHDTQERLEQYPRSLDKFVAEWNWAMAYRNDGDTIIPKGEAWARNLLETGIAIEARNGPIENKRVILEALANHSLVICDIWIPSRDFPGTQCSHYVLIVRHTNGTLLIHDPLPSNGNRQFGSEKISFGDHECGANVKITCGYFFSNENGPLKPHPHVPASDCEYSFLIVSKTRSRSCV